MRQAEGLLHALLDQDQGLSLIPHHVVDGRTELFDNDRRQPLQRLIEQEQLRVEHQRPSDRQHLLLASGELIAEVFAAGLQARKQRVDPGQVPLAGKRGDRQVLLDRQRGEDFPLLGDPSEPGPGAAVGGHSLQVLPAPEDGSPVEPGMPHDRQQQGAFADPVSSQQGKAFTFLHGQGAVIQDSRLAVAGRYSFNPQHLSALFPGKPRARADRRRFRKAARSPAPPR